MGDVLLCLVEGCVKICFGFLVKCEKDWWDVTSETWKKGDVWMILACSRDVKRALRQINLSTCSTTYQFYSLSKSQVPTCSKTFLIVRGKSDMISFQLMYVDYSAADQKELQRRQVLYTCGKRKTFEARAALVCNLGVESRFSSHNATK